METKSILPTPVEIGFTNSTIAAAVCMILGCKPKNPNPAVRVYTPKHDPDGPGEVRYFFEGKSSEFPATKTSHILGELHLASHGKKKGLLSNRGTAAEELDEIVTKLGEAIKKQNFNDANRIFLDLAKWLPLAFAEYGQAACVTRDDLMKKWVFDPNRNDPHRALLPTFSVDREGGVTQIRGLRMSEEDAALLDEAV